jgi:hypothetical protein
MITSAPSPYGYCPICGKPGKLRERRLNGNDVCEGNHTYPSKDSLDEPSGLKLLKYLEAYVARIEEIKTTVQVQIPVPEPTEAEHQLSKYAQMAWVEFTNAAPQMLSYLRALEKEVGDVSTIAVQRRRDQERAVSQAVNWAFRVAEERGYITGERAAEVVHYVLDPKNQDGPPIRLT